MRKFSIISAVAIMLLLQANLMQIAAAEISYVAISQIRSDLPERWTGEYMTQQKEMVEIDAPIVAPDVDKVPIVRISWNGPVENLDESLRVTMNEQYALNVWHNLSESEVTKASFLGHEVSANSELAWDEAASTLTEQMNKYIPSMKSRTIECYYLAAYENNDGTGYYDILYYELFHGIPYLVGNNYRYDVPSERSDNQDTVPWNTSYGSIKSADKFNAVVASVKEIGVDVEDVPLLPFSDIISVLEKRVKDGYIFSLNEVRFGYMVFIDPSKKGKEFVLCPVWAAKGITRGDLGIPFAHDQDPEVLDQSGYWNLAISVVNAQTGEIYDFISDQRDNRRYVPHIITWDEVK